MEFKGKMKWCKISFRNNSYKKTLLPWRYNYFDDTLILIFYILLSLQILSLILDTRC